MPFLDHFRILAPHYDQLFTTVHLDRLQRLLRLPQSGRLLDVGGGTGRISQALVGLAGQVIVLDESRAMLTQAKSKGLVTVEAHAEQLPFEDGSFDRILVVDALHHVANVRQVLSECCRLLRPPREDDSGGRLVIEELDISTSNAKKVALVERLLLMRSRFCSADELVECMRDCRVQTEIIKEDGMVWVVADRVG